MKWKSEDKTIHLSVPLCPGRPTPIDVSGTQHTVTWLAEHDCLQVTDAQGVEKRIRIRSSQSARGLDQSRLTFDLELVIGEEHARSVSFTLSPDVPGQDERAQRAAESGAVMKSQLTGKVLQVLVSEGQKVNAGDAVVVIEAMKMENRVTAPIAGIIKTLTIEPQTPITAGTVICKIVPGDG